MDGEALSKKKESKPACGPTFNGWAGVIFLTLLIPLPDSGFPAKNPLQQRNNFGRKAIDFYQRQEHNHRETKTSELVKHTVLTHLDIHFVVQERQKRCGFH